MNKFTSFTLAALLLAPLAALHSAQRREKSTRWQGC